MDKHSEEFQYAINDVHEIDKAPRLVIWALAMVWGMMVGLFLGWIIWS